MTVKQTSLTATISFEVLPCGCSFKYQDKYYIKGWLHYDSYEPPRYYGVNLETGEIKYFDIVFSDTKVEISGLILTN